VRERIGQRVGALPGVLTVGAVSNLHLNSLNSSSTGVTIDGVDPPPGRTAHDVDQARIDTGFVAAAGLTLVSGRNFTASDAPGGPAVALVNAAFAERFWPGADATGRRFWRGEGAERQEFEIVGVVATAKIRSLAEDPRPFVYFPMMQQEEASYWLVARTAGPADAATAAVMPAIREIDPDVFAIRNTTMEQHLAVMSLPMKLGAAALASFALLALVMASVGLYGTVSYAVSQRSREVGIRMAVGADRRSVTRLLLWSGLRLVVFGAAAGLVLALLLARLLEGLLLGVDALDPLTFAVVPVVLVGVALLAAWVPARRAGRVDPSAALRAE
jgi:putative ABC transport system permease protein